MYDFSFFDASLSRARARPRPRTKTINKRATRREERDEERDAARQADRQTSWQAVGFTHEVAPRIESSSSESSSFPTIMTNGSSQVIARIRPSKKGR